MGTQAKNADDVIDTQTTDIFSTIEGSGYNIDGVDPNRWYAFVTKDIDIANNKIYLKVYYTQ